MELLDIEIGHRKKKTLLIAEKREKKSPGYRYSLVRAASGDWVGVGQGIEYGP